MKTSMIQECQNEGPDWLVAKIWLAKLKAKILAALVGNQNLPTSHNYHVKVMVNIFALVLAIFFLANSLVWQFLVANQAGPRIQHNDTIMMEVLQYN